MDDMWRYEILPKLGTLSRINFEIAMYGKTSFSGELVFEDILESGKYSLNFYNCFRDYPVRYRWPYNHFCAYSNKISKVCDLRYLIAGYNNTMLIERMYTKVHTNTHRYLARQWVYGRIASGANFNINMNPYKYLLRSYTYTSVVIYYTIFSHNKLMLDKLISVSRWLQMRDMVKHFRKDKIEWLIQEYPKEPFIPYIIEYFKTNPEK